MLSNTPQKIFHVGDLHFSHYKNHVLQKYLTQQLLDTLVREKVDVLYVGGDVVNDFNVLSPEQIQLVDEFFRESSKICPVIVLIGNHDYNSNNKSRLDALTPLIQQINNEYPIHYFKDSGVYNLYNIDWVVWSELDGITPVVDKTSNRIKIGCYHGVIKNSNAYGFKLTQGADLGIFDDCDIVFLNDIHKQQSFRNKTIWYSGSWYQTNWGEANDFEKGGIMWVKKQDVYEAKPYVLYNPYVLYKHEINNCVQALDLQVLKKLKNKYPEIKIKLLYKGTKEDFNLKDFKTIKKQLQYFSSSPVLEQKDYSKTTQTKTIGNTVDYFGTYFSDSAFLPQLNKLNDFYTSKTNKIHSDAVCLLERIEIENFGPFGERQVVNFNTFNCLLGVFAENETGKSFLFDALTFGLFGSTSRNVQKSTHLINKHIQKPAVVEITINKNQETYWIQRIIELDGKIILNFEKHGDTTESLNGKDRFKTQKVISDEFGDYNTFILNSLYSQKTEEFIDLKQGDKYDYFSSILRLNEYEERYEKSYSDLKAKKALIDSLVNQQIGFTENQTNLDVEQNQLIDLQKQLKTKKQALEKQSQQCDLIQQEINNINVEYTDVQLLTTELNNLERKQTELNNQPEILIFEQKQENPVDNKLILQQGQLTSEINLLQQELKSSSCPTCNRKYDDKNPELITSNLATKQNELQDLKIRIQKQELEFSLAKTHNKTQQDLLQKKERQTIEKQTIEKQIQVLKSNIEKQQQSQALYKTKQDKLALLQTKKPQLQLIQREIQGLESQVQEKNKNIAVYELLEKQFNQRKTQIDELTSEVQILELYTKSQHKKGIRGLIINDCLSTVSDLCNKLINTVFEFNIEFVINDKDEIHVIYLDNSEIEQSASQCSGMERFVINLAIKNALNQISLLDKLDTFMIDEGFGVLDANNLEAITGFLHELKTFYNKTIIITHIDYLKNFVDTAIYLEKTNGQTKFI